MGTDTMKHRAKRRVGRGFRGSVKTKRSESDNRMTDKEFVKLLDRLWWIDPEEEKRLLEESLREGLKKL